MSRYTRALTVFVALLVGLTAATGGAAALSTTDSTQI